jgi:hypothetical protein
MIKLEGQSTKQKSTTTLDIKEEGDALESWYQPWSSHWRSLCTFEYKLCYYCPLDYASTTQRIFQLVISWKLKWWFCLNPFA